MNNAGPNTPEGTYAHVAKTAQVEGKLGFWSKVGDGAYVPPTVELGSWSDVGHFARIGQFVKFGSWACVGMDAIVDPYSTLESHEYVPSGCRRKANGRTVKLDMPEAYRAIHRAFDAYQTMIPAGAYSHEEYAWLKEREERELLRVRELLPAYLEAHDAARPVGWLGRLVALLPA